MQILNKITIKSVCGELRGKLNGLSELEVAQIIGNVKDKESITGQFGVSYRLKGEFKATNLITQEQFFSSACFLPGLAEDLVINQMDGSNDALQFAFIIGIKPAENKVGYEYLVKPLIKPAENNALALIENQIKSMTI